MAATTREPVSEKNLDGYDAPPIPWSKVRDRLEQGMTQAPGTGGPDRHTSWLATVRPDGRPHVMAVGVIWLDGNLYLETGDRTRKAKNIAANPNVVVTVATHPFDIVVEGKAAKVTDSELVDRVAKVYAAEGWPCEARGIEIWAEYSAQSAGPPPWFVYEVVPETVFAVGTAEPFGAMRFDF